MPGQVGPDTGTGGSSGSSGTSGYSGFSGVSGFSGKSGFSGSGTSGTSGVSGFSGSAGAALASITCGWWASVAPNNSTTYFFSNAMYDGPTGSDNNFTNLICPVTGTVTGFFLMLFFGGDQPSNESVVTTFRVNSVDTTLVINASWNTTSVLLDTTHTAAVVAGDKIQIKIVTPAWATPPTGTRLQWAVRIAT